MSNIACGPCVGLASVVPREKGSTGAVRGRAISGGNGQDYDRAGAGGPSKFLVTILPC